MLYRYLYRYNNMHMYMVYNKGDNLCGHTSCYTLCYTSCYQLCCLLCYWQPWYRYCTWFLWLLYQYFYCLLYGIPFTLCRCWPLQSQVSNLIYYLILLSCSNCFTARFLSILYIPSLLPSTTLSSTLVTRLLIPWSYSPRGYALHFRLIVYSALPFSHLGSKSVLGEYFGILYY